MGYKIKSISYKGKKLVVKGYTYNTYGMKMTANTGFAILYSKGQLCMHYKLKTLKPGVRAFRGLW